MGCWLRREWFGPLAAANRSFTLVASFKASEYWIFCRIPLMSRQSYLPLPIVRAFGHRSRLGLSVCSAFRLWSASLALPTAWPTMPSADFCATVRTPRGALSSEIGTWHRPPQVSSIAFPAPLPDLQPWPLMDWDFAVSRPLVRPRMPDIRFLFVRPRFCAALPSDATSRWRPCALLILHLHQVG